MAGYDLPPDPGDLDREARVPKLLKTYSAVGARIRLISALGREWNATRRQSESHDLCRSCKTIDGTNSGICSTPAWNLQFGTIDFLTLLDLAQLSPAARHRSLSESAWSPAPRALLCDC
jgi:hypothetical protein